MGWNSLLNCCDIYYINLVRGLSFDCVVIFCNHSCLHIIFVILVQKMLRLFCFEMKEFRECFLISILLELQEQIMVRCLIICTAIVMLINNASVFVHDLRNVSTIFCLVLNHLLPCISTSVYEYTCRVCQRRTSIIIGLHILKKYFLYISIVDTFKCLDEH